MATATDAGAPDWRGRIGKMDASDLANFLAQGVLCHLACLKDDGTPYVVPCWFEWDGAEWDARVAQCRTLQQGEHAQGHDEGGHT